MPAALKPPPPPDPRVGALILDAIDAGVPLADILAAPGVTKQAVETALREDSLRRLRAWRAARPGATADEAKAGGWSEAEWAATNDVAIPLASSLDTLKITTKDRQLIPFKPNRVQAIYLDILCPKWRTEPVTLRGLREILLKARQFGFSTLILALFFLDTIATPHTQTVVIAHDTETTEKLFRIVQKYYNNLPDNLKPKTKYANRREFLWPDIDSYFFVGTAGNAEFGRGGTINNVHGSEVAFWPDAETLVAGLLQAVPADGNVFLETTANGFGNYYQEEYARARIGDSVFHDRFFAWFENPEYRMEVLPEFELTEEERTIKATFGLSDEQMAWRRHKKKELREKFEQEYPSTPDEAFLTSGNPYFDRDALSALSVQLQDKAFDPVPLYVPSAYPHLATESGKRGLSVWELPVKGRTYVIGADTAEGITDAGDLDYDAADVYDAETWTQVAQLYGRWDTHEYGLMLADLGRWYNTALVGVERNNHGHAVLNAMLYAGNYPQAKNGGGGVYFHQEYDEKKNPVSMRPGWPTTPKTKYFALDGLATSLVECDIHPRSRRTVSELLTYVKKPGGKAGGEGKSHDDAVVALSIADAMLKLRPRKKQLRIL